MTSILQFFGKSYVVKKSTTWVWHMLSENDEFHFGELY